LRRPTFPFCTIEPNSGIVPMPDPRLKELAGDHQPAEGHPADRRGVRRHRRPGCRCASGEGLGNKFLAHIREVDAITHVVRCFENADVIHVNNKVDPLSDIDTIDPS
jgi:ribosome-binding ATPase YchF (GTP1/OBG family)